MNNGNVLPIEKPDPMIDRQDKLIVALGQRLNAQNEILHLIAERLQSIDVSLRQIALASNPAPNFQRPLSEFPNFDWSAIGATILKDDADGVSAVEFNGQTFVRRSPSNKFDVAIWFSRCVGKDQDGQNKYARLITFKDAGDSEPIAPKAKKAINQ